MDLLERYLQAVGEYLPAATRLDTLAELRENLLAQMDGRSEELGRPLMEDEVAGMLKEHGRPVVVAARYLPQQYLVGPALFPFYVMTLRKVAPFVALVFFVLRLVAVFFGERKADWGEALVESVFQVIPTLLIFLAVVTIVFVVIERAQGANATSAWKDWNPKELPAVTRLGTMRPAPGRMVDVLVHCVWMAYVIAIPFHPYLVMGPGAAYLRGISVWFAPVWHTFYWMLIAVLILQLVAKLLALRSGPQPWRTPFELVTTALGVVAPGYLALSGAPLVATGPGADLKTLLAVNTMMSLSFRIVLVFILIDVGVQIWKALKGKLPSVFAAGEPHGL